jgi:type IX secretion system PorP/SprF family membrane protein
MMARFFFIITCLLASVQFSVAQQEPLYSQYMFNALPLNPAYAGSHEHLSATVIAKKQWLKIDGAPATQTLSVHAPVNKARMGLGLTAINDKIGVTSHTGLYAAYAYRIKFKKSILSLGLQAGFTNYISRFSQLEVRTPNDPAFATDDVRFFLPNFGGGVYYYSSRFYAGFSVPHILDHLGRKTNVAMNAVQLQHYFFTTGFVAKLSNQLKIKPSLLVRAISGAPIQADLNTTFIINEVLWLGVSYRTRTSLNFIVQAMLTDQLSLGYAYDAALNNIRTVNTASHELMLNYRFVYFRKNVIAPRYF